MPNYEKEITGLLLIDPYNDFTSEGGKVWDRLKGLAEANQCVPTCCKFWKPREGGYPSLLYADRRYRPGDYETWKHIAPIQKAAGSRKTFEYGT
jgi:ureidoacrylate peracid hydrolase